MLALSFTFQLHLLSNEITAVSRWTWGRLDNRAVAAVNRTWVIQPGAGHIGGWATAGTVSTLDTGRAVLPNQIHTALLHCHRCNLDLRRRWPRPAWRAGRCGGSRAQEEIKEEEIFCSYVNQISERCSPAREFCWVVKETKGTMLGETFRIMRSAVVAPARTSNVRSLKVI